MARRFPVTLWILASLAPLAVSASSAFGAEPSSYFWEVSKADAAPVRFTAITTGGYTEAAVVGAW